jgi:hypothetical protein
MNKCELMVVAMRRSGHHAIINWILSNHDGDRCFLNDPKLGTNPFITASKRNSVFVGGNGGKDDCEALIYNYEDCNLKKFLNKELENNHDLWLGSSKVFNSVLVLRDPFNLMASKLRWFRGNKWKPSLKDLKNTPVLWKQYAKEFLGETNFLKNKICINYNEWFSSLLYKKDLAKKLDLCSIEKGVDEVAKWGPNTWGDSFDNIQYEGKASKMEVLKRWACFKNDKEYIDLVNDKELLFLSKRIFGDITEGFF